MIYGDAPAFVEEKWSFIQKIKSERKKSMAGDTSYFFIFLVAQLVLWTDTIPSRPFFSHTALNIMVHPSLNIDFPGKSSIF